MTHRFKGQVKRIFATKGYTYIRLADLPVHLTPKDGYCQLMQDHENYNALYSLALAAAVNGYDLTIRTREEIEDANKEDVYPKVDRMVVDW